MNVLNGTPIEPNKAEFKIKTSQGDMILAVENVPVVPLLRNINVAKSEIIDYLRIATEDINSAKAEILKNIDKLSQELIDMNLDDEVTEEEEAKANELMSQLRKLQFDLSVSPIANTIMKSPDGMALLFKHALKIMCPNGIVTEAVTDAMDFSLLVDMVNTFIKLNRLDDLGKKILPQSLQKIIKGQIFGELGLSGLEG